jgi:hypothetical protein
MMAVDTLGARSIMELDEMRNPSATPARFDGDAPIRSITYDNPGEKPQKAGI